MMRANFRMQRLFVEADLAPDTMVEASPEHYNYLANVLRLSENAEILVFNGRNGEWRGRLLFPSRKRIMIATIEQTRPQPPASDLWYLFAPLKTGRMDYVIQKAVEMGAGTLQPVLTQHVQGRTPPFEKMQANAIEAAEQCGILTIPTIQPPIKLFDLLDRWPDERRIVFCDESHDSQNPVLALKTITQKKLAVLIGPEGGFSQDERDQLHQRDFVTAIALGPRILRADTAAVAAMAILQSTLGDWNGSPA